MKEIHPKAAEGFTARAETYAQGRPEYPEPTKEWLRSDLRLGDGKRVLDLGAGTGKLSPRLLAAGADVLAVEPVPAMLAQLTLRYPAITALQGSAEHIPLPDAAVDAVVCAQSFHWFATGNAIGEIHRVLKPGGFLGLIWNVRDESVPWVAALTRLIEPFAGDAPRYWKQEWRSLFPAPGFSDLRERRFPNPHIGPPAQVIVDRVLSISFIAALPDEEQQRLQGQIRGLIASTPELEGQKIVTFPYETVAFSCMKLI